MTYFIYIVSSLNHILDKMAENLDVSKDGPGSGAEPDLSNPNEDKANHEDTAENTPQSEEAAAKADDKTTAAENTDETTKEEEAAADTGNKNVETKETEAAPADNKETEAAAEDASAPAENKESEAAAEDASGAAPAEVKGDESGASGGSINKKDYKGKWLSVKDENIEECCVAAGMNWFSRKYSTKMKPTVSIGQTDDKFVIKTSTLFSSRDECFNIGEEYECKQPDGHTYKATSIWKGDQLATDFKPKDEAKGGNLKTITREIQDDGQMIMTIEVGEVTGKRYFKKAEEK